ncbi:LytTR family transcriptional regulator [Duganella sp. HH101]|uniref:LytTR family transcriptional regulator n=1 Tax=Duganella sp. HH101 TaxID=1781066 RepID=UPI00089403CF|nr:LytTR family transcriptional regulator [Duganella sp. HH101]OFA00369.1 hypothetical protein DUGA2_49100 [Duganella sp. HH101]
MRGSHMPGVATAPPTPMATASTAAMPGRGARPAVVNLSCVGTVVRGVNETAALHLREGDDVPPVSRGYLHHFRQMWVQ